MQTGKINLTCCLLLTPLFSDRRNTPAVGLEMELVREMGKRDWWEKHELEELTKVAEESLEERPQM